MPKIVLVFERTKSIECVFRISKDGMPSKYLRNKFQGAIAAGKKLFYLYDLHLTEGISNVTTEQGPSVGWGYIL